MKYYRYSMNMVFLNVLSIIIFIPIIIYIYVFGYNSYINLTTLVLYFFWMFLHEFLHGIGFSLSRGINHKNIVYGAALEKGIFYCMCKELIDKKNIMISLMFPFFFIGVVTFGVGLIINNPILIILSLFNVAGCAGDFAMFLSFVKLPDFRYIDIDDSTGFVIISRNDLSSYKLIGMKLSEVGNYDDLELAKNYKKISVSKLSWCVMVILVLLLIVSFFV